MLNNQDREYAYILDSEHRFYGVVSTDSLRTLVEESEPGAKLNIEDAFIREALAVNASECLQDILPQVASHTWPIPVIDDNSVYKGVVSKNRFLRTLYRAENSLKNNEKVTENSDV